MASVAADVVTLAAPARFEMEAKKSRFAAVAAPTSDLDQIQTFLAAEYDPDASHHCWAWQYGKDYRFNDDGEPAGTAGRPIYAVIEGQQLDQVTVLVRRYYGGIKLGVGGLVRAYGGAAGSCLATAQRVTLIAKTKLSVCVGFDDLGRIHGVLKRLDASKLDEAFSAEGARIVLEVASSKVPGLQQLLTDATHGRATFNLLD